MNSDKLGDMTATTPLPLRISQRLKLLTKSSSSQLPSKCHLLTKLILRQILQQLLQISQQLESTCLGIFFSMHWIPNFCMKILFIDGQLPCLIDGHKVFKLHFLFFTFRTAFSFAKPFWRSLYCLHVQRSKQVLAGCWLQWVRTIFDFRNFVMQLKWQLSI